MKKLFSERRQLFCSSADVSIVCAAFSLTAKGNGFDEQNEKRLSEYLLHYGGLFNADE